VIIHSPNSTLSFTYSVTRPVVSQGKSAVMCHSKLRVASTQNSMNAMKTDYCKTSWAVL